MAASRVSAVEGEIVRMLGRVAVEAARGDGELLRSFVERGDGEAFAELVRRHGPMVFGVCQRLLQHHQDAEDAFQAAFLVLARRAESVSPPELVGSWLHGVALNTARKARSRLMRRRDRQPLSDAPEPIGSAPDWDDVAEVLDEELARLPDHYRAVVLLCDVEGLTQREAGMRLGCPEGSVASRLSRARALLARRLSGRGVTLSAAALGPLLAGNATAAVPAALLKGTLGALAAGTSLAAVSPAVITLANGVLRDMVTTKLKAALVTLVALGLFGLGGAAGFGLLGGQTDGGPRDDKAPAARPKEDRNKLVGTWHVVEVHLNGKHQPREGSKEQTWTFSVDKLVITYDDGSVEMRYVAEEEKKPAAIDLSPTAALEKGSTYKGIYELEGDRLKVYYSRDVAPGAKRPTRFRADLDDRDMRFFVLKRAPKPAGKEARTYTAWGEAIDGLQAGLGFRPGERRAYRLGETVTLAVRIRNVGKRTAEFEYLPQFLDENPPGVTDSEGKSVVQGGKLSLSGFHVPVRVTLEPGKEIELESRMHGTPRYELLPLSDRGKPRADTLFVPTGKVGLQYSTVLGNTSSGRLAATPNRLRGLATGTLELEVEPAAVEKAPEKRAQPKAPKPAEGFAWGAPREGLRLGIGAVNGGRFLVALENVGEADLFLNLGNLFDDGKVQLPTAIWLSTTDARKQTHVLNYALTDGRKDASRAHPYVVPLPAGSRYTLALKLVDFAPADKVPLPTGRYALAVHHAGDNLVGKTTKDLRRLTTYAYWKGTAASATTRLDIPAPVPGGKEEAKADEGWLDLNEPIVHPASGKKYWPLIAPAILESKEAKVDGDWLDLGKPIVHPASGKKYRLLIAPAIPMPG